MDVSIVIPCWNEAKTIADTVRNAVEGLARAGVKGEVLVMDSSSDGSGEIASANGARVVAVPRRGLGRAYLDALPHIRGRYVVMGDADCTYDFREADRFIQQLDDGYEFVMGTRMKGVIERGAMPPLHRYFGTPVTTWMLNSLLGTGFSDIHCGLRALPLDVLKRMRLHSQSWEYASEMVVKSALMRLRSIEVPIHFYKDRQGRQSHHKRAGWFSPWQAGWINLRVMFLYAPNQMMVKPGLVLLALGLVLMVMQARGPVTVGPIQFSTSFTLLGLTLAVLGVSATQMGILVATFSRLQRFYRGKVMRTLQGYFTYTRGMLVGFATFLAGLVLSSLLVVRWSLQGFQLAHLPMYAVFGIFLIILGMQTVLFNLAYQAFWLERIRRRG